MSDQPRQSLYGESDTNDGEQIKPLSLMDLISGVFSEPVDMFKRLSERPQWAGAMVLITALALVFSIAWLVKVDMPGYMSIQFERAGTQIPPAQMDQVIEASARFMPISVIVGSLFSTPVFIFFFGLLYWAVGLMSKEDQQWRPTYYHGLVVASIPSLATVPYFLLGTTMALMNPVGTLRPDQIIPSTFGYWIETDSPKLSALYSSIDLFLLAQYVFIFFAAKYALRAKTWGAALCVVLALAGPAIRVLFAK